MIPVGHGTLGRIMDVIGEPIDERGPIEHKIKKPIHADAPEFVEQSTSAEVLITGIKVVDLLAPYARGGKIGLFGGAGVGKTVFIQELIVSINASMFTSLYTYNPTRTTSPKHTVVSRCLPVWVSVLARATTCTTKCKKPPSFSWTVTPKWPWCSDR